MQWNNLLNVNRNDPTDAIYYIIDGNSFFEKAFFLFFNRGSYDLNTAYSLSYRISTDYPNKVKKYNDILNGI